MNGENTASMGSGEESRSSITHDDTTKLIDDDTRHGEEDDELLLPNGGEEPEKEANGGVEDMDAAEKQALIMAKLLKMPIPVVRSQLKARWLMLFLLCMALIGSYYCYDNPTAIHNQVSVVLNYCCTSLKRKWDGNCSWQVGTVYQVTHQMTIPRQPPSMSSTTCYIVCIRFQIRYVTVNGVWTIPGIADFSTAGPTLFRRSAVRSPRGKVDGRCFCWYHCSGTTHLCNWPHVVQQNRRMVRHVFRPDYIRSRWGELVCRHVSHDCPVVQWQGTSSCFGNELGAR
eukprot:gb/GECG01010475.1/.p1 GENE.gb/GECG01010475.1/~~gb/GECG01010475.1/.p1  ORF type:complete len:285 (+),score=11.79 gb/GECG01010475.1/:1-855(+)